MAACACGAQIIYMHSAGGLVPVEAAMRRLYLAREVEAGEVKRKTVFGYVCHWHLCPRKNEFKRPAGVPE